MATFSGSLSKYSVLGHNNGKPTPSFRYLMCTRANNTGDLSSCKFVSNWLSGSKKISSSHKEMIRPQFSMSRGGSYGLKFDDEDSFWVHLSKEMIRGLKSLLNFLAQQPGQLKYIEWPSYQDTLRTATLTLILVAALIVALSSIDAALSYVLALLLRKPA